MRLVDGEEGDAARLLEEPDEALLDGPFGGDVEDADPSCRNVTFDGFSLVPLLRRVDARRRHPALPQAVDLVLHEGDEGRYDEREPLRHHGRHLVTEGFARPRRDDRQHIAPLGEGVDHLLLVGVEGVVPEVGLQGCVGGRRGHGILVQ